MIFGFYLIAFAMLVSGIVLIVLMTISGREASLFDQPLEDWGLYLALSGLGMGFVTSMVFGLKLIMGV